MFLTNCSRCTDVLHCDSSLLKNKVAKAGMQFEIVGVRKSYEHRTILLLKIKRHAHYKSFLNYS